MTPLKIFQSFLAMVLSFSLTACQDSPRGYSEEELQEILSYAKEAHYADYELAAMIFDSEERNPTITLSGPAIPEIFQHVGLEERIFNISLALKPISGNYIKFVDTLNLHCDGRVEYVQKGQKFQISQEQLFEQGRWRPLHLNMCGRWMVPENQRLLIIAYKGSRFQDLDIQTSPNSLFSLTTFDMEYSGEFPRISAHPLSGLMLTFY